MSDPDRPLMTLLGSYAARPPTPAVVERVDAAPPEMPSPEECIVVEPTESFPPPFMGKVELRIHPDDAHFAAGKPRFRGWFRLRNDEPIDAFGLIVAVDAFPPTIFNASLPVAWAPTLELTAHLRARPEPGWLRCQFTTRFITGGLLEEDGEVWDQTGRLVAQSRQLALLPLPAD
jgi:acyl-CoA thioesterase